MMRTIRDLESMPLDVRIKYSKILSGMTIADKDYNQLKLGELYRIIKKIELPHSERIQLIKHMSKQEENMVAVLESINLDNYLNDQEKNIFRFSLMKDLINIMKSDWVETEKEKIFLREIQDHFSISDEQLAFFYEEYELDRIYFDKNMDRSKLKEIIKEVSATAAAVGIPLSLVYNSGSFKGLGTLGAASGLMALGRKKKRYKHSLAIGLGASIAAGIITYKAVKCLWNIKKDEKEELAAMVKENMEALHEGTKNILYEDIEYFIYEEIKAARKGETVSEEDTLLLDILKRTVATLENTEAIII